MFDQEDLRWLAANTTELNRLLQRVCHSVEQARKQNGAPTALDRCEEHAGQACRLSQALFDRVTARILSGASAEFEPVTQMAETNGHAQVRVKLPAGEIALASQEAADPPIRNPEGKRELILLVDDDEQLLETTGDMLDFEDYRVVLAKDGFEALQVYRHFRKKIALVILDYFLPVMDGAAVFDELKAIDPEVRVVLSSGFKEQARLGSMLARGLRGFLPKPYTHEKLIEQVRLIIDA